MTSNYEADKSGFIAAYRGFGGREENETVGPVVLQDIDAVTTGFNRAQYRLTHRQREWEKWYANDYAQDVFPDTPTMQNGLAQLNEVTGLIPYPWFRLASDFHADGALSEMPAPSGWAEGGEAERWWLDYTPMMRTALRRGAHYWSMHNYAVFATESEPSPLIRAVSPRDYYRVGLPEQRDADIAHVLAFPFRDYTIEQLQQSAESTPDNRIEIIKVHPSDEEGGPVRATTQTFVFNGEIIGMALTPERPSTITGVFTAGEGHSWYPGAAPTIAAHMIAVSMLAVEKNIHANRPIIIPLGIAANMLAQTDLGVNSEAGIRAVVRTLQNEYRPVLAASPDDESNLGELQEYTPTDDRIAQIEHLEGQIALATRVTPSAFGFGIGKGESGAARDKAEDAARVAMTRFREQIAAVLPRVLTAMGAPGETDELQFAWSRPPLTSSEAYAEQIRMDYEAGLLTRNEARQELGRAPVDDGGDEFKGDAMVDDMADGGDNGNENPMMMMGNGEGGQGDAPPQRSRMARFMRPNG